MQTIKDESGMEIIVDELLREIKVDIGLRPIIIGLEGPLGAGKTVFTKLLANKLGIKGHVTSPTFTLVTEHQIPNHEVFLQHIDIWRIEEEEELIRLGLQEMLNRKDLLVIEWADKFEKLIKSLGNVFWVKLEYGKSEKERIVTMDKL